MINQHTIFSYAEKLQGIVILLTISLVFSFSIDTIAQSNISNKKGKDCVDCFSSTVISSERDGNCLTIKLEVSAGDSCASALSHFTVSVPCGEISDVYNSEGWKVEVPSTDPTTGLSGFKIDDITGFGENRTSGTFIVEYTVCSSDTNCLDEVEDKIEVAYKAGTCVFYQELESSTKMQVSLFKYDVSCFGGNNGSISLEVEGGAEPYSFLWSNGANTKDVSGLRSGNYKVIVNDINGEELELSTEILQPEYALTINGFVTPTACGNNIGKVDIEVAGGTSPYTYVWNNGKATEDIDSIYAGSYFVNVYDSLGCPASATFQVTEDSDLSLKLTPNYLQCHEEGLGVVESSVSGGVAPYEYLWSNEEASASIDSLNSGTYSLTVTDANGCSVTQSTYVGIASMSLRTSVVNPTCNGGDDGQVAVTDVFYGTAPYQYVWNTGDTTNVLSGVSSGRYRVTVTDANGCETSRTINLADRAALSINYSISERDCSSESPIEINLIGSGGSGSYQFYHDGELVSSPFTVDGEGDYEITMVDGLGCETSETVSVSIANVDLSVSAEVSQPMCGGASTGAATLVVSGGTLPFNYSWIDGSTQKDRDDLLPGYYQVNVVDANGCSASTDFVIDSANVVFAAIIAPQSNIICNTDSNVVLSEYLGADTYTWELVDEDQSWIIKESSINNVSFYAGNGEAKLIYSVMDAGGCMDSDTLIVGCSVDDQTGSDDGVDNSDGSENDDDNSNEDNAGDDVNYSNCFFSEISKVTPIEEDCYRFEMWVYTDGTCEHELSHLSVGLEGASVSWVNNSRNWKVEKNSTDPKTGIYGFKVDDINGFGQSGEDKFKIEFEACFQSGYFPDTIPVAYKASTGYTVQLLSIFNDQVSMSGIEVIAFPNPFKDKVNLTIVSNDDTNAEVAIYDIYGTKIKTIFNGTFVANVEYTLEYDATGNNERLFLYKVFTKEGVVQGKLLKVK